MVPVAREGIPGGRDGAVPVPVSKGLSADGRPWTLLGNVPVAGGVRGGRCPARRRPHIPSTSFIEYSPGARPFAHSAARTAPVA